MDKSRADVLKTLTRDHSDGQIMTPYILLYCNKGKEHALTAVTAMLGKRQVTSTTHIFAT